MALCASLALSAIGQSKKIKWAKPTKAELALTEVSFDEEAEAVVLAASGRTEFTQQFDLLIKKHYRIKILKTNGIDRANISIPFYSRDNIDRVAGIKAVTINSENGTTTKHEVQKSNIFTKQVSANWSELTFTFPAVKVGSILEYSYDIQSKSVRFLEGWSFQSDIPTLESEFTALIPKGIDFRPIYQGKRLISKYATAPTNVWKLANIPALKEEPYVTNRWNYSETIRFQLEGYYTPKKDLSGGSEYVTTSTTWEKLADEILTMEQVARYLSRPAKAKPILEEIVADRSEQGKAKNIYSYVQKTFSWNGNRRYFSEQTWNSLIESKKGSSGDINLFLVGLLQGAGIDALPALVSTRSNGFVQKGYPLRSQFNQVLAYAKVGGKEFLLDATNPALPFGVLEAENLNGEAYLLDKGNPRWIPVAASLDNRTTFFAKYDIAQGMLETRIKFDGHHAGDRRRKDIDRLKSELYASLEPLPEAEIDSFAVTNWKEIEMPLEVKAAVSAPLESVADGVILISPITSSSLAKNPFISKKRIYPVEFPYPFLYRHTNVIVVPEGMAVDEIPKEVVLALPNKYATFTYSAKQTGRNINVTSTLQLHKVKIPENYYAALQQFFDQVIAKLREPIVLNQQ